MKKLSELTLLDKFLFDEAMDDPEVYEAMLRIILGDETIKLLTESQTEKELRTAPWLRSIRVDVFAMDENQQIYNTEMQKEFRADLIKRSRYYQALIDSSLLKPGTINFNELNNTIIIMITPFDLFGMNRIVYSFESICEEDTNLRINDGAKRIFINTHGTNTGEVSPELVALIKFIEYNETKDVDKLSNRDLFKIRDKVSLIKKSEEIGVKYMQNWEEKLMIHDQGYEEGKAEGKATSIYGLVQKGKLSIAEGAEELSMPEGEFIKSMEAAGYKVLMSN